jgi:hypothetical protein
VRQCEEHHLVRRQDLRPGGLQLSVGQRHQVRVVVTDRGPGAVAGGHRTHLEARVRAEQAQQLAARVPARPRYRRAHESPSGKD